MQDRRRNRIITHKIYIPNNPHNYSVKIIDNGGVACVSIVGSGLHYGISKKHEPKGEIIHGFKDKVYNRGTILRKLGLWDNGQNLMRNRKPL